MDTATDRLNIRIPPQLKQALREQAKKEGRTLAGLIIFALRQYLAAQAGADARK